MFAVSENMRTFVSASSVKAVQPYCYIFNRNHKAGFLRQYRFGGLAEFAKTQGSLASFVIYLPNFFLKMANSEKVSGAVKHSTRTASIERYSTLKSQEKTYRVVVFGGILVHGQGFGHCISYILSAKTERQAISMAMRKYSRRPNALPIHETRVTHIDDSPICLTSAQNAK